MSGVAAASFIAPAVVKAAAERSALPGAEASFILCLGGLFGIMPDTLDFKLGQFFSKAEVDVECDPENPDPQKMAETIGKTMDEVHETGKYKRVQLFPMRLGSNLWRQYVIKFDGNTNEVIVVLNEIVSTSQVPFPGTEPKENRVGKYKLKGELLETHGRPSVVDILSGPQFGFHKEKGKVTVEFLPWHRTWSHSYVLGLLLAIPFALIPWLAGFSYWYLYGLTAFLGFATHITEDLTGHMGGSLIWPFIKKRSDGLSLFRASNPHANFSVDFISTVIILFNLARFTNPDLIPIHPILYFFYFLIIPLTVYFGIVWIFMVGKKQPKEGAIKAEQAIALTKKDIQREELMSEDDNLPV